MNSSMKFLSRVVLSNTQDSKGWTENEADLFAPGSERED